MGDIKKYNRKHSARNGLRNRRIGHQYERDLANQFNDIVGYTNCRTSRYSSKLLDDCKVDLNLPDLNVQAKNVKSNINYSQVFDSIDEHLTEKMPERKDFIKVIFHKKLKKEIVILTKEDFYRIWKFLKGNNLINNL